MPAYNYTAMTAVGKNQKGVIAADSQRDARKRLQAQNLYPLTIELSSEQKKNAKAFNGLTLPWRRGAVSVRDQAMITRQLATLITAGTPIDEALRALAGQSEKAVNRHVLTRLHARVSEGEKLSVALAAEPDSFSPLYQSMVAAGEASGDLGSIMTRIADYSEKSEQVRATVQTAMIYPAVLTIVASFVLVLLMTFVVPRVVEQFESFGAELPLLTQIVIVVSHTVGAYGLWILAAFVGSVASLKVLMRRDQVRTAIHGFYLALPVLGKLIRSVSSARFARTLGTLLDGGSPMLEAISAAKETVGNQVIKNAIQAAYVTVREGKSLSASLKAANQGKTLLFMPLLVYMVAVGEKSGSLSTLLGKVADYLEQEFDGFTKVALSLLEPMIVIVMGVMVGLIVIAIMLPILQLNSLVLT